jgi:CRISPR-associated endonuclease Csy4
MKMDHYIDITLKPDAEMRENVLLNMVYAKLHKALFNLTSTAIGVSFPDYQVLLGKRIRLHGASTELEKLQSLNWLAALSGYCGVSAAQKVPQQVQHRVIGRKQSNMKQAKLNRLIKRGTIAPERIKDYKAKMFTKSLDNPYVELKSTSNGEQHRRYFEFGELQSEPVNGKFDYFGLSKQATVPWF